MTDWFARCPSRYRDLLEAARELIPGSVRDAVGPRFLVGHSPHFVGLHYANMEDLGPAYGDIAQRMTYDDCAHACYGVHHDMPTVVFPKPDLYGDPVSTLLHEWGHLFDEATGFWIDAPVTTAYSRTNREERFAEAFEIILKPQSGAWSEYVSAEAFKPMREAMGV